MLSMRFHTNINPMHFMSSICVNFSMVPQLGVMQPKKKKEKGKKYYSTHFCSSGGWKEVYAITHFHYFISRKCQLLNKNSDFSEMIIIACIF